MIENHGMCGVLPNFIKLTEFVSLRAVNNRPYKSHFRFRRGDY